MDIRYQVYRFMMALDSDIYIKLKADENSPAQCAANP